MLEKCVVVRSWSIRSLARVGYKAGGYVEYVEGLVILYLLVAWSRALKVLYIRRESNQLADYMAKGGLLGNFLQFNMPNLSSDLLKIVLEDAKGIFLLRRCQGYCNARSVR